ncbi:MAG: hypothetical protein KOO62_12895 [candidate division Zixibacteria bacterium]|nr:hypothetical protein [candidate division Zixibacteria bacterium]
MRRMMLVVVVLGISLLGQIGCTQEREIFVGEVETPSWEWGEQIVRLEVVNNGSLAKFIVAETEIQFTGEYLNPSRHAQTCYVLAPGDRTWLEPKLIIPGNYGKAQIWVRLYDVVDTLDLILPGQLTYEQPFSITYHLADGMVPYFQDRVLLPPRIRDHPDFDNEFARVLLWLLDEGRTITEIADMAECDTSFVKRNIQICMTRGYVRLDSTGYHLNFPILSADEAHQGSRLANEIGDTLASLIAGRMDAYRGVLDSLVAAGNLPTDTNTFMDGGTVLYHRYPVIGGLALWWDLGGKFISPDQLLEIYTGNDLCNTYSPTYMYAVQGNLAMAGTNFYAASSNSSKIYFGDRMPDIQCGNKWLRGTRKGRVRWQYTPKNGPESFIADSTVIRPAVNALTRPADKLLVAAGDRLQTIATSFGHNSLTMGYKYWFWDLVATRALNTLVESDVVTRRGNGQFRFDGIIGPTGK